MDKKVQISLFSMEMRTLEPSPPGFSQPGTSKEYTVMRDIEVWNEEYNLEW